MSDKSRTRRRELPDEPPADAALALAEAKLQIDGIEEWTLENWHQAITRMRRLSVEQRLGLHDNNSADVLDLPYGPGLEGGVGQISRNTVIVLEPRPVLSIINKTSGPFIVYPDAPEDLYPLHAIGELIPCASLPVMVVSLSATDEHIRAEVERILRARSKVEGLHLTTEARPLTRSLRSGHAIAKWQRHRIVELVEILAWNAVAGRRYPMHVIGLWIDPSRLGTSKAVDKAKTVARQAIAVLPEIMAELSQPAF